MMQAQLATQRCSRQLPQLCAHKQSVRLNVVVRGSGEGKEIREFREDTGEITVPGEKQQQQQQGALYADQVAMVRREL